MPCAESTSRITRRDAIRILGGGAVVATLSGRLDALARPQSPSAALEGGPIIRTILEDIAPERLTGITLIHEHLDSGSVPRTDADLALGADEVEACAQDGVTCIVDAGTDGLGRKIDALYTISSRSGMHIVACGGLHRKSDYPVDALTKTVDQITDDLVQRAKRERWGAIGEMGTGPDQPMDPTERKGLEAASKAHLRTGLAIITHTDPGTNSRVATDQIDLFERAGVDLRRVVVGHLNDITDQPAAVPIAIAKRGAYLGFDHSGRPDDPRADEYARTILAVLDAGLEDRVCLSSDFNLSGAVHGGTNQKYLRKNGGPGIDMVLTTMIPRLKRAGVPDATLHRILVENPRRVLTFVPVRG